MCASNRMPDLHVLPTPGLQQAAQACCPLLEGDRAKGEWIACCSKHFSSMAKRLARDDELAKDALQISWMKIVQAANVSLGGPTACPWVAKVVANNVRDLQREKRDRKEEPLEAAGSLRAEQNIESTAQERQMLELLREMVAMLPDTYRQVYALRMQEERSVKETAERLGITESNVTTTLSRAVRIIEGKLKARTKLRGQSQAGLEKNCDGQAASSVVEDREGVPMTGKDEHAPAAFRRFVMTQFVPFLVIAVGLASVPARTAAQSLAPSRSKIFSHRDVRGKPIPGYQAGYVFGVNASMSAFWVDHEVKGPVLEQPIDLPNSFRQSVGAVAVSFDERIAVSAGAADKEGRLVSALAWFKMDGSLIRIVRTSPFAAAKIGFTVDGSLWAIGVELLDDKSDYKPGHDVMRQYGTDGSLVRSIVPWSSLATVGGGHPVDLGLLLTSRNYAALISTRARTWTLVSPQQGIVSAGSLQTPQGFEIIFGGVTDSGRLFVNGQWSNDAWQGQYPHSPVFEIATDSGALELVEAASALPIEEGLMMLGSEGENLVFHARAWGKDSRLIWARAR